MFHRLVEFFRGAHHQSAVTFHYGRVSITFDFKSQNFFRFFRHMGRSVKITNVGSIADPRILAHGTQLQDKFVQ